MPIYGYKCTSCGKTCEKIQKFSDGPPEECPECGDKGTLEKQLSTATGFLLKEHGWHRSGLSAARTGHK